MYKVLEKDIIENEILPHLSTASVDGSHIRALCGGEKVEFQTRKMSKTPYTLYLIDNQGIPIGMSSLVSENHHDLYKIDFHLEELFQTLGKAKIETDSLFVNADVGFDSKDFRTKCFEYGIIPNTAINPEMG